MRKKNRRIARKTIKRVSAVNTLLEQLKQLAVLRTQITTTPKRARTLKRTLSRKGRPLAALRRGATPIRLLLRAPRRIADLRRLRRRSTPRLHHLQYTTLQSKKRRAFVCLGALENPETVKKEKRRAYTPFR